MEAFMALVQNQCYDRIYLSSLEVFVSFVFVCSVIEAAIISKEKHPGESALWACGELFLIHIFKYQPPSGPYLVLSGPIRFQIDQVKLEKPKITIFIISYYSI